MIERRRRRRSGGASTIIGAILIAFVIEVLSGAWSNPDRMRDLGAIVPHLIRQGEYWRLLTAMFLHGNGTIAGTILHLTVNLLALVQLGPLYESMFGTRRFVTFYFACGLIASLTSYLRLPPYGSSVGASGAIFGILGAFVFSVLRSPRWRHERWARNLVTQCVFWIAANIMIGLRFPQIIDHAAHMGGLVAGLLLGALVPHRGPPPPPSATVIDVQPHDD